MHKPCSDKVQDIEIKGLIDRHFDRIEAAAQRVLGADYINVLEDLRQEVGIAIWRMFERGQSVKQWEAFIYHCAHKRSLDLLKRARRRRRHEILFNDMVYENPSTPLTPIQIPAELLPSDPILELLSEEMAKLPPVTRLIVLWRKGEGYSRAEVARMLNCSLATVDYRLRQGLQQLRKKLQQSKEKKPHLQNEG